MSLGILWHSNRVSQQLLCYMKFDSVTVWWLIMQNAFLLQTLFLLITCNRTYKNWNPAICKPDLPVTRWLFLHASSLLTATACTTPVPEHRRLVWVAGSAQHQVCWACLFKTRHRSHLTRNICPSTQLESSTVPETLTLRKGLTCFLKKIKKLKTG